MNPLVATPSIVEDPSGHPLLDSIRQALTEGPRVSETLIFLCGAISLLLLILLAKRFFGRDTATQVPQRVDYLTLAVDLLGLSESDRRDLRKIAGHAGLEQPAAMLLSPANLARAAAPTFAVEKDSRIHRRIDEVCQRLFGESLPVLEQCTERSP